MCTEPLLSFHKMIKISKKMTDEFTPSKLLTAMSATIDNVLKNSESDRFSGLQLLLSFSFSMYSS